MQKSILVVDDEASVRLFVRQALSLSGYEVAEAADGQEAFDRCAEQGPFDLVLTDIVMPRLSGCQLATRLADTRPGLPVLFMSGQLVPEECQQLGIPIVRKPFRLPILLEAIRKQLEYSASSAN